MIVVTSKMKVTVKKNRRKKKKKKLKKRRRRKRRKIGRTEREKGDLNNHINFQICTFFASQVGFFKRKKKLTADQRKMLESSNGVENEGLEGVDKTAE